MSVEQALWEGIFRQTAHAWCGAFNSSIMRGWAFLRRRVAPGEISSLLSQYDGRFWHQLGENHQLTPLGSLHRGIHFPEPAKVRPAQPVAVASVGPSITVQWFKTHYADFIPFALGYLAKRLPISARTDQLMDHIQAWVALALARDSLAKSYQIGNGRIHFGIPALYIYRHASASLRKLGRNPGAQATLGALPPQEVAARRKRLADKDAPSPFHETFVEYRSSNRPVVPDGDQLAGVIDLGPSIEEILDLRTEGEVPVDMIAERLGELLGTSYLGISGHAILADWQELKLTVESCAHKHKVDPLVIRKARQALRTTIKGDGLLSDLYPQTMMI